MLGNRSRSSPAGERPLPGGTGPQTRQPVNKFPDLARLLDVVVPVCIAATLALLRELGGWSSLNSCGPWPFTFGGRIHRAVEPTLDQKKMVNRAPPEARFSKLKSRPWARRISRTMVSPMPWPLSRVVKNGVKRDEVYFGKPAACCAPRFEPRRRWPRGSRSAGRSTRASRQLPGKPQASPDRRTATSCLTSSSVARLMSSGHPPSRRTLTFADPPQPNDRVTRRPPGGPHP